MAPNYYTIVWDNLLKFITPSRFWVGNTLHWITTLIAPLISRQLEFTAFSLAQRYFMQHTGQVMYLEKVLNEKFGLIGYDPTDHEATKSIYIIDGDNPNRHYLYLASENTPLFLNTPKFIFTRAELDASYNDFIVKIPLAITYVDSSVRAVVDVYRLAGKFYKIERP